MRSILVALTVVGSLSATVGAASAADGCSYGPGGQLYCQPGANPGVPYGYGRRGYDYGDQTPISERGRYRGYGDQTPISERRGYRRGYNYGDQTPYSERGYYR